MAISAVLPTTLVFGHRGIDSRTVFVTKQETAQDLLAGAWTTAANLFATQANALETNVNAKEVLADNYGNLTGTTVEAGKWSAKEFAVGDLTTTGGSAKAWATDTASPDGTTSKSAKTLAGEAVISASNAATSATNAATSATNAYNSELAAAALLDSFDDRYLGSKAIEPTLDNDGNALVSGALYFNTVTNNMKVYDSVTPVWIALSFIPTDHGGLVGLADDDHTQYHNDARGDIRYYTKSATDTLLNAKQATLVSGTNLKTINGGSLLGSGDISVGSTPITSNIGFAIRHTLPYLFGAAYSSSNVIDFTFLATIKIGNYLYTARSEFQYNSAEKVYIYKINLTTYEIEAKTLYTGSYQPYQAVRMKFIDDGVNLYLFTYEYNTSTIPTVPPAITKFDYNLTVILSKRPSTIEFNLVSEISSIFNDSTYFYFMVTLGTNTWLYRYKKDGTESKYITISKAAATLATYYEGFAQDTSYIYFSSSDGVNCKIVKVSKATFTVTTSAEFTLAWSVAAVDANYIYLVKSNSLCRLNISTLAVVDTTLYSYASIYKGKQIGTYIHGDTYSINMATLDLYSRVLKNMSCSYAQMSYGVDSLQYFYIELYGSGGIDKPLVHINLSNFIFGTSYYSSKSKISSVATLATKSAGTAPVTSAVMTIGTPTAVTVSTNNPFSALETFPLTEPCSYIDQI